MGTMLLGSGNRNEAILALAEARRSLESFTKDFAAAIEAGKVLGSIASRYLELEKSPVFRWLLQFEGLKKGCLLTKVATVIECGTVGIFTKAKSLQISP